MGELKQWLGVALSLVHLGSSKKDTGQVWVLVPQNTLGSHLRLGWVLAQPDPSLPKRGQKIKHVAYAYYSKASVNAFFGTKKI